MRCVFHLFFFFFSACPEIHIFFSRKQEHVDVYGARSECLPDQERLILESLPGTQGRGGHFFRRTQKRNIPKVFKGMHT